MAEGSELGWGAGGVADALQLVQTLQADKIANAEGQVKLEASQLALGNQKKLQAALGSGQFGGLSSSDPQEQMDATAKLAQTYLANGMPEQAKNVMDVANQTARTKSEVTAQQATTALNYLDTANKVFGGVTSAAQWHAAQQLMQSELPPEALKNPAIKGLLTSEYDPAKVQILPQFLENLRTKAQTALDKANALRSTAETKTQEFDQNLKESETRDHDEHVKYLKKMGGDTDELGDPSGDKMSKLRYLIAKDQIPLPLGTRSMAARTQFMADAIKNNPDSTPEEIVADMKSGYISMRGDLTEAGVVARREASISAAQTSLVEPHGLYDQLDSAAQKVNFGDSKIMNKLRDAVQQHVYASPEIQALATTLEETRADLGTVLSRTGTLTDAARAQAEHALPLTGSLKEMQAAIKASRQATDAIQRGNTAVLEGLRSGKTPAEVLKEEAKKAPPAAPKAFANEAAAEAAAKAGRIKKGDSIVVNGQTGTWQ